MHPNKIFRDTPNDTNIGFARDRGYGLLAVDGGNGPVLAHVPFVIDPDAAYAEFHLHRGNPVLAHLDASCPGVIAVSGPDSYVSPDWYGVEDQVPTWNYVAVHLRGAVERLEDAALGGVLDRLSASFETRLAPKRPWTSDKMDPAALARMMRAIVPCRMRIERVDGTWKLGQNKSTEVRERAASGLDGYGIGQEIGTLAALMRGVSPAE